MNKKIFLSIFSLIILLTVIKIYSPFAFAKDGFLTKMKVSAYESQYDLGITLRHDENIQNIYLFYFGVKKVSVRCDATNQETNLTQIFPFLYKWTRYDYETAYRVTIGNEKYYFTIVSV